MHMAVSQHAADTLWVITFGLRVVTTILAL
jgi:hypothetical protein